MENFVHNATEEIEPKRERGNELREQLEPHESFVNEFEVLRNQKCTA